MKKHFSLADWDYRVGAKLELATDRYISAPTALRTQDIVAGMQDESVYLGSALGLNIPDGRYLTWHRNAGIYGPRFIFCFRCQDTPYTTLPDDCYYLFSIGAAMILYRREAAVDTEVHRVTLDPSLQVDQWYHFRISFYQYIEGDFNIYLRVIVEEEVAGEWVELFNWYDGQNKWFDSAFNRLGFMLRALPDPNYEWKDVTQVWEKT